MQEKRIEKILKISPELLEVKFKGCRVTSQEIRGGNRLDLLVHAKRGAFIVEIKKSTLSSKDVDQLLGYCRSWSTHNKIKIRRDAYLVGLKPLNEEMLRGVSVNSVFRIHLRYLGVDVPMLVQEKDEGGYEKWKTGSLKKAIRLFD